LIKNLSIAHSGVLHASKECDRLLQQLHPKQEGKLTVAQLKITRASGAAVRKKLRSNQSRQLVAPSMAEAAASNAKVEETEGKRKRRRTSFAGFQTFGDQDGEAALSQVLKIICSVPFSANKATEFKRLITISCSHLCVLAATPACCCRPSRTTTGQASL
jgi:uncharacterized membrane protein